MPETFLILFTIIYVLQVGVFIYVLRNPRDRKTLSGSPTVTVVIAARNEEHNLSECLQSVMSQTYPADRYDVIVANDNSTDGTERICDTFAHKHRNFQSFVTTHESALPGKPNALAQAIDRAHGEVILITDADCVVPPTWIESTAKRHSQEIGIVGGITLQKADSAFSGMQSLDWAYILGVAASTAAMGLPLGGIGNNLSFRKEAYDRVGGYRKLKFSVTEDYTLVQAIIGLKKYEYLYPIDEKMLVQSHPCPDFRTLIQQKHRWGKGGLDMKPLGFLIMAIGFGLHAALLIHLLWFNMPGTTAVFLVKFVADYFFLHRVLSDVNKTDELRYFYWFELYYFLYVLALPFLVFFGGKIFWKGRHY